ncbi:uncharacterized protein LOC143916629 [Arctopsyche grandis]|uniref:uncharacterized protein LOC143916629 n=1 Tax=Arctopsyche grandis TaxID=121162 RepID=UPI00406D6961
MDSLKLTYDQKMNCSLAEEYFKQRGNRFVVNFLNNENGIAPEVTDNYGNTLVNQTPKNDAVGGIWYAKRNEEVLNQIAINIKANIKLISQVEYLIRNIPSVQTEKNLKIAIEYFQHYADLMPRFNISDVAKNLSTDSYSEKTLMIYDDIPLWKFAYSTAAFLALGDDVIVYANINTTVISILFSELFCKAGLPDSAFRVVSTEASIDPRRFLTASRSFCGTTFAVFESCDQDSAIDTVVRALYPFDYTSLWSLKQIFVQESIHKSFISKLSKRIARIELDETPSGKLNDFVRKILNDTDTVLKHSATNGVELVAMHPSFYTDAAKDSFKPLVLLDTCLSDNLWESFDFGKRRMPLVGLQAFRTTKEAVNMINRHPSQALSVWCDNSAISDELATSVDVSCIWINSYERSNPNYSWTDNDTFIKGGIIGMSRILFYPSNMFDKSTQKSDISVSVSKVQVEKVAKLLVNWKSLTFDKRASVFSRAAIALNKKNTSMIGESGNKYTESSFNEVIEYLHNAANFCNNLKNNFQVLDKNNICIEIIEPHGVIGVGSKIDDIGVITQVLVAPLIFGNAIVLFTPCEFAVEICKFLAECGLPVSGFISKDCQIDSLVNFDAVKCIWNIGTAKSSVDIHPGVKFTVHTSNSHTKKILQSKELLESYFSKPKIIWKSYGETFAN